MRDRVERLKLSPVADLESMRASLLDELSAVHMAIAERAQLDVSEADEPLVRRIGKNALRQYAMGIQRQPLKYGLAALFLLAGLGAKLMEWLNVG